MIIFNPTHYGSFLGIPCLIDMSDCDCPAIEARYYLDIPMAIMEFLFGIYCTTRCCFDPEFEPMFPILIKGQL